MKDILIFREENNVDKSILEFLKNKYLTEIIDFNSKDADFHLASGGFSLIVAFIEDISPSSVVVLRRILMYQKDIDFCLLGTDTALEKFAEQLERDNVHCIELPQPAGIFQKHFEQFLNQNSKLSKISKGNSSRKHSVLLVDDDPVCLRTMMSWLQNFYQVAVAKSGAACIAYLGKTKPDLILLDYEMPVCNGIQTLEMIRSEPDYSDIPVVFLTGVSDNEKVKEAIKLKPQGYILKNTDRIDFLNKIGAILGE